MAKEPNSNGMHIEYHTVDRKKEKAADCIYLDEKRICRNKNCHEYLSKCFASTACTLRVKSTDKPEQSTAKNNSTIKKKHIVDVCCTLPLNCEIENRTFGKGTFKEFNRKSRVIYIDFGERGIRGFQYPESFYNGFLSVSSELKKCVKNDKHKARKR